MLKNILLVVFLLGSLCAAAAPASDSVRISLDSAERRFLAANFQLLAQKYNIDAQKALEIQARLYPNPNLSASYSLYNSQTHRWFPTGSGQNGGELQAQLSQLIYLAGQRNKQVRIAQASTRLSVYQFYDLVRTLKYSLRTDFYNIHFLLRSARLYDDEIRALQQVVDAFAEQEGKGYIAPREVIRVKAQLYALENDYNDLQNQINDAQSDLRLILQVRDSFVVPEVDSAAIERYDPKTLVLNTLLDSAMKNRTDLQIARATTDLGKLNLDYQKALAVPNLTMSLSYDQQGSYVNNLSSLGAAIDLPFFNRNKGNIRNARIMNDVNAASQLSVEATVHENVFRALEKAIANEKLYRGIDPKFMSDFEQMLRQVLLNYEKRNINLLDFLDFYDAYKESILAGNTLGFNRVSAFEDINFYTGTDFFRP